MKTISILPVNQAGEFRTHIIRGLTADDIAKRLGFGANVQDDPSKVRFSWGFTVNGGRCGVWDYKGSHLRNIFSAWGPVGELRAVFGEHVETAV